MDDISLVVGVDYSEYKAFDKHVTKNNANLAISRYRNQKLQDSFKNMAPAINRVNKEMRTYSQMQMAATKSSNQLGVVTQQAGYQVGDFLVQIQSGTNPLVAFGQQATQLVGILPLLGPSLGISTMALIGLSTALGIGIPLVTAIGAAFYRSSQEAEKASGGVKTFEDALKSARKASVDLQQENIRLAKGFKDVSDAAFASAVDQAMQRVLEAEQKLEKVKSGARAGGHLLRNARQRVDAAQAELDIANAELRSYRERLAMREQLNRNQEIANSQNEVMNDLYQGVAESLEKAAQFVKELEDKLGKSLADAALMSNLDLEKPITLAAIAASNLAANLKIALAQQLGLIESTKYGMMEGSAGAQAMRKYAGRGTTSTKDPIIGETGKSIYDKGRKGGGGKSPAEQLEEYMKKQENLVELQTRQIGLSEEQARIEDLKNRYVLAGLEPSMQRIQALAAEEEALRRATEAEQRRQSMMDSITGHIENGFMAMIDGSASVEDAFKGMLRNILLEIYRQQIAKPMASGIMKLFGFADGGAFSSGRVIPFANGGVVSSPTTFPMPGATGLMGEAGPEAIMPLKRGPNGKLGVEASGGQQVVVNQSFNFAANGDESVKKIIAQAAPHIAQMTQKQIMDSRRRGGQMKAAFS